MSRAANTRTVVNTPEKILDAPDMLNDFYLHLMDWSSLNHVAVRCIIRKNTRHLLLPNYYQTISGSIGSGGLYLECCRWKYCSALSEGRGGGVCHLCLLDCSGYKRRLDAFLTNSISSYWRLFLLSFIHQGNVLGVGNSDGTVQLWDVASSKLIRSMAGHTDRVSNLHFRMPNIFVQFSFQFSPLKYWLSSARSQQGKKSSTLFHYPRWVVLTGISTS